MALAGRKTSSCSSSGTLIVSAAVDAAGAGGRGGGGGGNRGGGRGGRGGAGGGAGDNPPGGAVVQFFLKSRPQGEATLEILDGAGKPVNKFSTREAPRPQAGPPDEEENPFRGAPPARLTAQAGLNRFVWNLRYPDATTFPGLIMWASSTTGPRVAPGKYTVRLTVDGKTQAQTFEVKKDPRLETTPEEYAKQLSLSQIGREHVATPT